MSYTKHITSKSTPQLEKAREDQVENTAGGFVFAIDDWKRFERFLIIGNEGGTYYASERKLTVENYNTIKRLLSINGKKVIDTIVTVSDEGRAPKNEPAIFALAVCSVFGDLATRTYANKMMPKVCRFATALYSWVHVVNELKNGKKSQGLKRAISRWYVEKTSSRLSYQICKYPSRSVEGKKWSHRDLLRIARPGPNRITKIGKKDPCLTIPSDKHNLIFRYSVKGIDEENGISTQQLDSWKNDNELKYIFAHESAKTAENSKKIVELIKNYKLTRESIPNQFFDTNVWKALLPDMPMTALIRNLGQMTAKEVFKPLSNETQFVINKLTNKEVLKKARIHPMNIFLAFKTYQTGKGIRTSWKPVSTISDALEEAFYNSFNYVEPTNKKLLIAVDVSGSMGWSCIGNENITAAQAAGVMAMTIARTEKNHYIIAFSCKSGGFWQEGNKLVKLPITAKDSIKSVLHKMQAITMGGTDCALPMLYATENKLDVDAFVILTDNETWAGDIHPFEAIAQYRKKFNSNAKLAALAFSATEYSVADPSDVNMMDIVGLDSSVPQILSDFISNKI